MISLGDILKCGSCDNKLTSLQTLGCFHTFCDTCFGEISRQMDNNGRSGFVCSLCGVFTKDTDLVSKHFLEKCLEVESYKSRVEVQELACLQCHTSEVCSKCLHCDKELCSMCQKKHPTLPFCADHRIVSLTDPPLQILSSLPVFCDTHPQQELLMHCVQCQQAVCEQCKTHQHQDHHSEHIDQAVKKLLPEVRYKMQNYHRRIKQLNQVLSSYDMEYVRLEKNVSIVKKQLEDHKNKVIAKVESDYEMLSEKIDDQSRGFANDIYVRKSWVQNELRHQESLVSWVNNVTSLISGACLFIELHSSILKAVQESDQKLPLDKLHRQLPFLTFNPTLKTGRADNALGELGFSNVPQQLSREKSEISSRVSPTTAVVSTQRGGQTQAITELPPRNTIKKLDAILGEEEPNTSGGDFNRNGSPSSAASTPSTKAGKTANKQVSFLRTLITPLEEDEEIDLDGRISRASNDRLSRASVNIPVLTQNGKKSFGQHSHSKKKLVKESSLDRSPARSLLEDSKRYDLTPTSNERSFRCIISSNFSDLTSVICKPTGEFKIKNFHNRMCFIDDEIWMLLTEENSMALYSTEGTLLKEKLQLANVERPHALHPLNSYHVLIASENGLFILHSSTMNTSQLVKGSFSDVCVDKTIAVALDYKQGKVYVLNFITKPVQKRSFRTPLTLANMYKEESKLVLCDGVIYLSIYNDQPILKYDLQGTLLGQFGQWGKGPAGNMGSPRICSVDNKGNLLVADFANNRLQVLNLSGRWSILLTHVKNPKDAVVMDSGMLYILTDEHKIFSFRAEKLK